MGLTGNRNSRANWVSMAGQCGAGWPGRTPSRPAFVWTLPIFSGRNRPKSQRLRSSCERCNAMSPDGFAEWPIESDPLKPQ